MKVNTNIKGFSLLEMLLVLIVIITIILISGRYYNQATESSRLTTTVSKIKKITEASYEWLNGAKIFTGRDLNGNVLSIQNLKNLKLLSPDDDTNPWGGAAITVTGISANKIQMKVANIPAKACTVLIDNLRPQNMEVLGCGTLSAAGTATATINYPADAT